MGSDTEELFASPSRKRDRKNAPARPRTPPSGSSAPPAKPQIDPEEQRDELLRRELAGVRNVNEVLEGMIATLERSRSNMSTVSQTVNNASTLLNTWTRILSQTEHNQRLILNPNWHGASADLSEIEAEAQQKALAAERRAAEEERRRQEAARRRAEEERQRQAATTAATSTGTSSGRAGRGYRGRTTRGASTRGGANTSSSFASEGASTVSRAGSGIGRGFGAGRGGRTRSGVR